MSNMKGITNLQDIPEGSIIRHKAGEFVYIVTANYGNRLTAVRTVDVTNPSEWEILERGEE